MDSRKTSTNGSVTPMKWHDTPSGTNVTSASKLWRNASLGEFSLWLTEMLLRAPCRPTHASEPVVRQRRLPSISEDSGSRSRRNVISNPPLKPGVTSGTRYPRSTSCLNGYILPTLRRGNAVTHASTTIMASRGRTAPSRRICERSWSKVPRGIGAMTTLRPVARQLSEPTFTKLKKGRRLPFSRWAPRASSSCSSSPHRRIARAAASRAPLPHTWLLRHGSRARCSGYGTLPQASETMTPEAPKHLLRRLLASP